MTVREFAIKHLTDSGLWPAEAGYVAIQFSETALVGAWWGKEIEGYPPQLARVLIIGLNTEAVKWIDANKPLHWARPMFAQGKEAATEPENA